MSDAIDAYERHLGTLKNSPKSIATTVFRLRAMLDGGTLIADVTPAVAKRWYTAYRTTPTRRGKPPADDTQLNTLGQARTFGAWCAERGWVKRNPFAGVKGVGARQAGKEQLTLDEARKLVAYCHAFADRGGGDEDSERATAVLCALYFGIRSTEILNLTSRDLDDDGRLLRVRRLKKRKLVIDMLEVPERLRPLLEARGPGPLFPGRTNDWLLYWCRQMCWGAGVPDVVVHALRGSLGSNLREAGIPAELIQRLLDHDSLAVTERHYIRSDVAAAADARARLRVLEGGRRAAGNPVVSRRSDRAESEAS